MGSGRGLYMELPPLSAAAGAPTAVPQAVPGLPPGGLPAFHAASGLAGGPGPAGPVVLDPRTGQPVMLVPVPLAPGQHPGLPMPQHQHQQQLGGMGLAGHPGMPGMGQQPDISSLLGPSSTSASAKPAAPPAKDPFADLLG
jgi:hypothetical protein